MFFSVQLQNRVCYFVKPLFVFSFIGPGRENLEGFWQIAHAPGACVVVEEEGSG